MKNKKLTTLEIGHYGEKKAAAYLRRKGFHILEMNYRLYHREVDIIAENRNYLVFAEVKSRTYNPNNIERYGKAADAVDYRKVRNIDIVARYYQDRYQINKKVRIDIIEVYFKNKQYLFRPKIKNINHISDIDYRYI